MTGGGESVLMRAASNLQRAQHTPTRSTHTSACARSTTARPVTPTNLTACMRAPTLAPAASFPLLRLCRYRTRRRDR